MPTGEPAARRRDRPGRHAGFTYLLLLFGLAIAVAGLAAIGSAWTTAAQRGREAELLFRGEQISRALASYARSTPSGLPRQPQSLGELVEDRRGPVPQHHLRRLYADPFTGAADWQPWPPAADERIRGVRSRSQAVVFRQPPHGGVDGGARASDWLFAPQDKTP